MVVPVPPGALKAKVATPQGSTKAHGLELCALIRDSSLHPT